MADDDMDAFFAGRDAKKKNKKKKDPFAKKKSKSKSKVASVDAEGGSGWSKVDGENPFARKEEDMPAPQQDDRRGVRAVRGHAGAM